MTSLSLLGLAGAALVAVAYIPQVRYLLFTAISFIVVFAFFHQEARCMKHGARRSARATVVS